MKDILQIRGKKQFKKKKHLQFIALLNLDYLSSVACAKLQSLKHNGHVILQIKKMLNFV